LHERRDSRTRNAYSLSGANARDREERKRDLCKVTSLTPPSGF
jgi:hypothetical protein